MAVQRGNGDGILSCGMNQTWIEFSDVSAGLGRASGGDDQLRSDDDRHGDYSLQTGSLDVTITPQEAIDAGAKWRRVGTSAWRASGTPETGIPVGPYTWSFKRSRAGQGPVIKP